MTIEKHFKSSQSEKEQVNYRNKPAIVDFPVIGKVYYYCDGCKYWEGKNRCSKVKGDISPNAVCDLWMFGKPTRVKR